MSILISRRISILRRILCWVSGRVGSRWIRWRVRGRSRVGARRVALVVLRWVWSRVRRRLRSVGSRVSIARVSWWRSLVRCVVRSVAWVAGVGGCRGRWVSGGGSRVRRLGWVTSWRRSWVGCWVTLCRCVRNVRVRYILKWMSQY